MGKSIIHRLSINILKYLKLILFEISAIALDAPQSNAADNLAPKIKAPLSHDGQPLQCLNNLSRLPVAAVLGAQQSHDCNQAAAKLHEQS